MALSAKTAEEVVAMDKKGLEEYFFTFARYFEDSPNTPYAIRVGSTTLFDADTYDLRQQFEKHVRKLRRKTR
jgi:hypothetical protein